MTIFNPASIPQFYDTLNLAFYLGKEKIGYTRLETSDKNIRNNLGEIQCFFVPANTIQSNSLINLVVSGSNKLILNASKVNIEYNTYWSKIFKKRRLISINILNEEQLKNVIKE